MNQDVLLLEGVTLMMLGMGFVFSFLFLLVGAIKLLSSVAVRVQPPIAPAAKQAEPATPVNQDDNLIAAISAALHHHKKKYS